MPQIHHTTTLADIDGESHAYQVMLFGFDESIGLFADLSALLGPTLAGALRGLFGDMMTRRGKPEVGVLLDHELDLGAIGAGLAQLPAAIAATNKTALLDRLFKHVRRALADKGKESWRKLDTVAARDEAFRGNYLEALKAIAWVLDVNYAPFFGVSGGLWSTLSELLGELGSAVESRETPSETDAPDASASPAS